MNFTKLVPNIFYADVKVGLKLFIDCLGFTVGYNQLESDNPFCVITKDHLKVYLVQSEEFALKDRPEIRLETDNIDEAYTAIKESYPEMLHPNLKQIKLQPWTAKEFALLDESGVCVIIQQW